MLISRQYDIIINNQVLGQPHNSIIDMVIVYGLCYIVMISILFTIFISYKKKKMYKFNKASIVVILTLLITICAVSLFWSEIFFLLRILIILSIYEKKGGQNEDIINK